MHATLPPRWQEINQRRHICHWWQDHPQRRITAMTSILALAALIALVALLVRYTRNDRFSAGPLPHDRFRDSDTWLFQAPRRLL
jgi:hypothetical protein